MAKWFKLQTPIHSTDTGPQVLLYNSDRSVYAEVTGEHAEELINGFNMKPDGDKVFVKATFDRAGHFVADLDTLTREDQF